MYKITTQRKFQTIRIFFQHLLIMQCTLSGAGSISGKDVTLMGEVNRLPRPHVVIIADENMLTRHAIRDILEEDCIIVLEAGSGQEALELMHEQNPDMILLGMMSPVLNGLEACALIKEDLINKAVPVLIMTPDSSKAEIDAAFDAGASDFVSKPINAEELLQRIRRLFNVQRADQARDITEMQLKESLERTHILSLRVLNAFEEERARLARELHDELGMILTTVKLKLQILASKIPEKHAPEGSAELSEVLKLVQDSLNVVHEKSMAMRPSTLAELGLNPAVKNMLSEYAGATDMETAFEVRGTMPDLPLVVETTLYRCVQESVTNAVRHSGCSRISVLIHYEDTGIELQINDNGKGFDVKKMLGSKKRLGLKGMIERVTLLNGDAAINSKPGGGTEIRIRIPISKAEGELLL